MCFYQKPLCDPSLPFAQDAPVGNWDGVYKGEPLCHVPSALYGVLLPVSKVSPGGTPAGRSTVSAYCLSLTQTPPEPFSISSPETKPHRQNPPLQMTRPILKSAPPPATRPGPLSPPASAPKVALMPPGKAAPRPPPPAKPAHKAPPLPPPKPRSPTTTPPQQQLHANGAHGPPSPLRSPGGSEGEEAGPRGELEVGSMVEVNEPPLFGVIRWVGQIGGVPEPVAGIELVRRNAVVRYRCSDSSGSFFHQFCGNNLNLKKNKTRCLCPRTRSSLREPTAVTSANAISVARPTRGCSSSSATADGTPGFPPPRRPSIKWSDATP